MMSSSLPVVTSQGGAPAPPVTCMDTNVPIESWIDAEWCWSVLSSCCHHRCRCCNQMFTYCWWWNITMHTPHLSNLTYFILSALYLIHKATMHFEISLCCARVFTNIFVRSWILSSLSGLQHSNHVSHILCSDWSDPETNRPCWKISMIVFTSWLPSCITLKVFLHSSVWKMDFIVKCCIERLLK